MNPRKQISDTHPAAEELQISLIRNASMASRMSRIRSISASVIQLSRRAITRANPGLNQKELRLNFISYYYGDQLADQLRKYLDEKTS
ncbi:hypothetical protein JXA32_16345 [Candidatus Sumerlaeota bacterium]|nr:hypothetical protein [Candidatus Sumerlaeota bacterium]